MPVVVLLIVAGLHVPFTPLVDVAGNAVGADPLQIAASAVNAGTVLVVTVCTKVCVVAQTPAAGVNVYVPVAVLLIAEGFHVPLIPFVEVPGNAVGAEPLQIAASAVNVGVVLDVTVCTIVVVTAHWPVLGVNV